MSSLAVDHPYKLGALRRYFASDNSGSSGASSARAGAADGLPRQV